MLFSRSEYSIIEYKLKKIEFTYPNSQETDLRLDAKFPSNDHISICILLLFWFLANK